MGLFSFALLLKNRNVGLGKLSAQGIQSFNPSLL